MHFPGESPTKRKQKASFSYGTMSIGAVVAGGCLLLSVIVAPSALPRWGVCWFHRLTGRPCPACGMSRAFCAISHGMWLDAWAFNPFAYIFYLLFLYWLSEPFLVAWGICRPHALMRTAAMRPVWIALIVAFFCHGLLRMFL
ncbi:MAG: DUF2752 domain-containing protein [Lentisphaerae bacterium]|nr:MAG: DUF2752 domain-containing protein [Lentisphaerota bacterium]